ANKTIWMDIRVVPEGPDTTEAFVLRATFFSKWSLTTRGEKFLNQYSTRISEIAIGYAEPNTLFAEDWFPARDSRGFPVDATSLQRCATELFFHFYELIAHYELCARLSRHESRSPERQETWKKVLPSRQIQLM